MFGACWFWQCLQWRWVWRARWVWREGMARIIAPRKKGDTNTLAAIKANENFVVRLTPEPNSQDSSNYRVTITIEGRGSNDCYVNHKLDDDAVLGCDVVGHTYIFNFNTHRFIEIYGANENSPHVARGLCTKISQ
jgi:hypothetical protein